MDRKRSRNQGPSKLQHQIADGNGMERRDFLRMAAVGAAGATIGLVPGLRAAAMATDAAEFAKLVPPEKKLDPGWVKSLFERGTKKVYSGAALERIGMPIGGFCAGQLYLGGDGKLWRWDIFNQIQSTADGHYANPPKPDCPLEQGFGLLVRSGGQEVFRKLDRTGFDDITFRGEYPIGKVAYRDAALPVTVSLEAFSPFVPLNTEDSSLPAAILQFTVKNTGKEKVEAELVGWLQNAVCLYSEKELVAERKNRIVRKPGLLFLNCSAESTGQEQAEQKKRPDIVFEDFQKKTYEGWTVTGTSFGTGPILNPAQRGLKNTTGSRLSYTDGTVGGKDEETGTLTSKEFTIDREYINFWIGGGHHPGITCINLLIDGKAVCSATGQNNSWMRPEYFLVRRLQGQKARLEIVDKKTEGSWGSICVSEIIFSDKPVKPIPKMDGRGDYGTLGLGLLDSTARDGAWAAVDLKKLPEVIASGNSSEEAAVLPVPGKPVGALARKLTLEPGQSEQVVFVVAWCFPNLDLGLGSLKSRGRFYAKRFPAAVGVAEYVASHFERLAAQTRLWRDTWYDSTLPSWLLDRAMANTSTLATSTCHRFDDGRFYAWEGVGSCEGTCTHVWQYAQAVGRLFPELERDLRRRTDFGTAQNPQSGEINHRGEIGGLAVDGQAGCILRAYREHQMSRDDAFLRSIWPKVKLAMQCLVRMDDGRGMLEGPQHNTLDQPWFGRVAWLSSLYVCAARACEEMADEVGDKAYAEQMKQIVARGGKSIDRELFNGEYYYQIADAAHKDTVGSHNGCEIDQVFGQSWAYQVNLGRILDEKNVKTSLRSLWKYNFAPDVGPFRKNYAPGRWFAMPGEAGLLMCSWPQGDASRVKTGYDYYLNECMNGFEYQVAGHMIWEGMVLEGLAIARAVHDRYDASRRNPWNEVECGDHYARSMASYGVFLAACGYRYHGPKGFLAFAPRLSPEDFRAAFTTAEGWGTFSQRRDAKVQRDTIELKYGQLSLRTLAFELPDGVTTKMVRVSVNGNVIEASHRSEGNTVVIDFQEVTLKAGEKIEVVVAY